MSVQAETVTASPKNQLDKSGFSIINNVYSPEETERIATCIDKNDKTNELFRKSADLYAIRQFFKEVPNVKSLVFNHNLRRIIQEFLGTDYFIVKSMYFDKPPTSNWFVSYHRDLTISVDRKVDMPGFSAWTVKQNQFSVQAPLEFLKNIFTVRIHLDDTDEQNGALKIIPGSHRIEKRSDEILERSVETACPVPEGGIMLMKPLLLHSSGRTINSKRRRVIHIEFSNEELPKELKWAEKIYF